MRSEGGLGPDLVSPIWTSTRQNDTANNALLGLGVNIGKPQRGDLTAGQYGELRELSGSMAHNGVDDLIRSKAWETMTADEREDEVRKIIREARRTAREVRPGEGRATPRNPVNDPWAEFGDAEVR